ncbi:hypothetical protein Q7P37_007686 [Cladosporium fusiforme]
MSRKLPFTLDDPSLLHEASYLGGEWVQSNSKQTFDVEDPGTLHVFAQCPMNQVSDVDAYVRNSQEAFVNYATSNPRQRAKWLLEWYRLIENARKDLAKLIVYETGKPIVEARGEVDYANSFAWWFAGEAERVRGSVALPAISDRRTFIIKQPIGVAVALIPWNFPVTMAIRKISAALAAGCSMIVKPSPETPLSILALADLATRSGFPPGVLNVITTDNANTPSVSEALCKHPDVRKVTFTGSTAVGKLVAKHCSFGLKKVTLELGGNCPFIVFDDADLDQAIAALMILKWRTAGQACTHANRVYVQSGVYERFANMIVEATKALRVGHGADSTTTMGALTTPNGIQKIERHISDAVSKGGRLLCGGRRLESSSSAGNGNFFQPTIIADMSPSMLTTREEIFGPLLGLYRFSTEEEVVRLANDTSMGLASYFFTNDVSRSWRLLERLEAGMIGMNTGNSSAAESPFGGIKESGYGKEAGKDVAIEEYLISKTGTLTVPTLFGNSTPALRSWFILRFPIVLVMGEITEIRSSAKANLDDVVSLTQALMRIDSSNPDLGLDNGAGETAIAKFVSQWLQDREIECHWIEPTPGRPSVVGIVRGSGGGKSLMFNGHLDTVNLTSYDGDALSGRVDDGNIYGRGSADMKSGLAAEMLALATAKTLNLRGDVILAAVADEEMESIGTEQVLRAGWRADAAIVAEPTEMAIINAHKGLAVFYVDVHGTAAHGSRPDLGVDAICKAGYFLVAIDRLARNLQNTWLEQEGQGQGQAAAAGNSKLLGAPSIHAGIIKGGAEVNSYPASCTISIERRTIPGETLAHVQSELEAILSKLTAEVPDFKAELRTSFSRSPFGVARDHDFVRLVEKHASAVVGAEPEIKSETYWTDMALLADEGIPGVIWGPRGFGLHAAEEWVEIESLRQLVDAFVRIEIAGHAEDGESNVMNDPSAARSYGIPEMGWTLVHLVDGGGKSDLVIIWTKRSIVSNSELTNVDMNCNLMTDEEVSQNLLRLEKSTSTSDSVVAGPFTVFNLGSQSEYSGSPAVITEGVESPATIIEVESVGACSGSTEEVQGGPSTTVSSESPDGETWVDFSSLSWVPEAVSDTAYIGHSTTAEPQRRALEMPSYSSSYNGSSEITLLSAIFGPVAPQLVEIEDGDESLPSTASQVVETLGTDRIPQQLDTGIFGASRRGSTNNILIHHYAKHMVHLMQPIIHSANPFEKIYLSLAIRGSSDLEHEGSPESLSSPRVAVCHSLLSAAANNLQGLRTGDGNLGATACYHRQKALITLRNALASRSSAYKELMTAILALVSVDILNGGTQDHWVHLDAAMQLQASRHFANVVSSDTRQLNTICTMLHLFAQTALLSPEPKPWGGSWDVLNGAGLDALSPSIEYIYGISRPTANALLKIYRLSQCLNYHKETGYPENLMQACEDLGDELCSWSATSEKFTAIESDQVSMLKVARAQAKAFHHAALIYYYRSIQKCAREDLHMEQKAVLAAMNEAESLKKAAPGDVAMPAPITWPAFMASCEAVGDEREGWREWWQQIQRYKMANYASQQDIVLQIWQEMDKVEGCQDWRELLVALDVRVLPV